MTVKIEVENFIRKENSSELTSTYVLHQERGILKEAKLERRMQLDPLKEATPATNEMLLKRQPGRNDKQVSCFKMSSCFISFLD